MSDTRLKCKVCRSAGEKLILRGERCFSQKCAMVRHAVRPGVHGKKRQRGRGRSEYGMQLKEKQALKYTYLLRENQLRNYFDGVKSKADSGNLLLAALERRLDNAIFRLGFSGSRKKAKQMVSHGHFLLNGKRVTIPSIILKIGDTISVREASKGSPLFADSAADMKKAELPSWLSSHPDMLEAKVIGMPLKEDIPQSFEMPLVVEFYSR